MVVSKENALGANMPYRKIVDSNVQMLDVDQLSKEDGLDAPQREEGANINSLQDKKNGEIGTQMNIMSTIMGIAILSLPSVFKVLGIVVGALLLIVMVFVHYTVCMLLVKVKNITAHANYTTMGLAAVKMGWIKPLIKITIIFLCFGVSVLN